MFKQAMKTPGIKLCIAHSIKELACSSYNKLALLITETIYHDDNTNTFKGYKVHDT